LQAVDVRYLSNSHTQVTLSLPATSSSATALVFAPYGVGDGWQTLATAPIDRPIDLAP
jgi:hypothetical protein